MLADHAQFTAANMIPIKISVITNDIYIYTLL